MIEPEEATRIDQTEAARIPRQSALIELTPGQIDDIARKTNLPSSDAVTLIQAGNRLTACRTPIDPDSDRGQEKEHPGKSIYQEGKLFAVNISSSVAETTGIFVHRAGVERAIVDGSVQTAFNNRTHESVFPSAVVSEDGDEYFVPIDNATSEYLLLPFEYDSYPHTENAPFYVIYGPDSKPIAIIPLFTERLDERSGEGVYFRGVNKPLDDESRAYFRRIEQLVDRVRISLCHELGLPTDYIANLSLILNNDRFRSRLVSYRTLDGGVADVIVLTKSKLEFSCIDETGEAAIARHELLHVIDRLLGENGEEFSSQYAQEIVAIVNRHTNLGIEILEDRDRRLNWLLSEQNVMPAHLGVGGHPSKSTDELFVSCANAALEPNIGHIIDGVAPKHALRKLQDVYDTTEVTSETEAIALWKKIHHGLYQELLSFLRGKIKARMSAT